MKALLISSIVMLASVVLFSSSRGKDPEEKVPTIKQMMNDAHRCNTAYVKIVATEVKKPDPSWPLLEQKSRELVQIGKWLGQNTPPKGTAQSWERFTNSYVANASIMLEGALKHDKDMVLDKQKQLFTMCAQCHRAHR